MSARACTQIADAIAAGKPFYALEFFPPHTVDGARNLVARMDRMSRLKPKPLFVDATWTPATGRRALETLVAARALCNLDVQLHLTCTTLSKEAAAKALDDAAAGGVRSLLILRGDPLPGAAEWAPAQDGFKDAEALVAFIRARNGDTFSIAVAGHPAAEGPEDPALAALKRKVDAGADYVVTQMLGSAEEYSNFVKRARSAGITCPIVPGVLVPPPSLPQTLAVYAHSHATPPPALLAALEAASGPSQEGGEEAVRAAGAKHTLALAEALLESGAPGLYFFTLNLERSVAEIVARLPALARGVEDAPQRAVPFLRPRAKETVRPIFWAANPGSYLARTHAWGSFPVSWGEAAPEGGGARALTGTIEEEADDSVLSVASCVGGRLGGKAERRGLWGEAPTAEEDLYDVFERFIRGLVPRLPWRDALADETDVFGMRRPLASLNNRGFLTINSQPRVNAASSEDATVGWGPAGGKVFQKAYLEFFCNAANLDKLLEGLASFPSLSLEALTSKGERRSRPAQTDGAPGVDAVTALTWGTFQGEVRTPTVADSSSFQVWSKEAMTLFTTSWADIYPAGSPSRTLVEKVRETYWHAYIVDHDVENGDIFKVFSAILGTDISQEPSTALPRPAPGA